MSRRRHEVRWAAPRHHARWGGDGPAVAGVETFFAVINDDGDRELINDTGDFALIQGA